MSRDNLQSLFKLYFRPVGAMSEIIDRGSWLFGALGVVVVSAMLQFGIVGNLYQSYQSPPVTYRPRAHTGAPHTPPATREMFKRAVEAVNTNPYIRHARIRK